MELSPSIRSAKLVTNNSRFLILPDWHFPNLASRILSLCQKRLPADWQAIFGHPVLLIETFVDPQRFRGTIYKAANWIYVGDTKGFHRTRKGYSAIAQSPKMVFVKPLIPNAQALLSRPVLQPAYRTGGPKIMLSAQQMQSLPRLFCRNPRSATCPRTTSSTATVLAIAAGATLCGCAATWPSRIGPKAWGKMPGTISLPTRKQALHRTESVHHPRCADPRGSRASGPCPAALEPNLWPARRIFGH
jgi:hypothetical protein